MKRPSTVAYALLGLLGMQPWTGYELTRQVRRSLRLVWPSSEAAIYREQQHLVTRGWADVTAEPAGRRTRNRYTITPEGRVALHAWLASEPAEPALEIEGLVRLWLADQGTPGDLAASMRATADACRRSLDQMQAMLQAILAGHDPFPQRTQINVLSAEVLADMLGHLERRCRQVADEADGWTTTSGRTLDVATRRRIEALLSTWGAGG